VADNTALLLKEKNKLIKDIKRMKDHYEQYEPTISALKRKYEAATREKSLIRIERDGLRQSLKRLQATGCEEGIQDTDTIKGTLMKEFHA
jgi:regulator of replication initiation timing